MEARCGVNVAAFRCTPTIALLAAAALIGCSGNCTAAPGDSESADTAASGWQLVWSDEFRGTALDAAKWNIQTGDGSAEGIPGWGNGELQSYQANNVSVSDGNLVIRARQEAAADGRAYTSGRINTSGKLDITYGRIEASIQAPGGQGMWSAFWMLPTNNAYGPWPASGEIDIMEVFSRDTFTQAALHFGMASPLNTLDHARYSGVDPADGFHSYALEWDERTLRWFMDGVHFHTAPRSAYWTYHMDPSTNAHVVGAGAAPFDRPFHLLLNLAVGGHLPGPPGADALPAELRVDHVRVYQCGFDPTSGVGCAGLADPLAPAATSAPPSEVHRAAHDLYEDAAGPLRIPATDQTLALDIAIEDAGGTLILKEIDADDRGRVIDLKSSGSGGFSIQPANATPLALLGMGSASDPARYAGELQFDLQVFSTVTDAASSLRMKLDSGPAAFGFVDLPVESLTKDEWTTVTVQISDLVHHSATSDGKPIDLAQLRTLFTLELIGRAHLQLDNIRLLCGHVRPNGCGIALPTP